MKRQIIHRLCFAFIVGLSFTQTVMAKQVTWCVFDFAGNSGDIAQMMKDYALNANKWGVKTKLRVFLNEEQAINEFNQKKCDAVVGSSYLTRQYNNFLGSIGAIGLIPNNQTAQHVFLTFGDQYLQKHMIQNEYEGVGWIPIGPIYFMVKDRSINSITHLAGLRIGILKEDPAHNRMARRVGASPVIMSFNNAAAKFLKREIDVLPAPIYAYYPFELQRGLGLRGGVINFPIAYLSLNLIIRKEEFPKDYGQLSRQWFVNRTPRMMHSVLRWEQMIPKKYWYDIPVSERQSYQRLLMQLRREFITSRVYNYDLNKLVLEKQCELDRQYFECTK